MLYRLGSIQDAQNDLKAVMKKGKKRPREEETNEPKKKKREEKPESPHVPTPSQSAEESSDEKDDGPGDVSENSSDLDKDVFEKGFQKLKKTAKKFPYELSQKAQMICNNMTPALVSALPTKLSKYPDRSCCNKPRRVYLLLDANRIISGTTWSSSSPSCTMRR